MNTRFDNDRFRQALPDLTGSASISGLEGPVEIHRDRLGIPHVRTTSLHDAFLAQGFVHAQDRLWQMEFDRRRAAGRAAECAGPTMRESDILMRRLGLAVSAKRDYEAFDPETKLMLDAYAQGVNAFIDMTKALPVEFSLLDITPQRWEPWHSGAIFKVRHVLMGNWGLKLWRARLLRQYGPEMVTKIGVRGNEDGVVIVPPGQEYHAALADLGELDAGVAALAELPEFGGSNNWAVHGSRTASGKPLSAGDPHRFLDVPNVYYQCHLACPDFDVIGFNFAGIPGFPHFAHNQHVAWCITHAMADYQDLYVERLRRSDSGGYDYEFQGEWQPAEFRNETISVRDQEPVEIEVVVTNHGPIVIGDPAAGHAVSMRYTALEEPNPGLTCLLPQLRATSVADLDEAMRNWVDPCNSLIITDTNGTIGYLHRGLLPIRSRANAWLPVPGWTGEYEWQGYVPFEEVPRLRDPEAGFIATANNRVVGADYPYYLSLDYAPPYRALRLVERLSTIDDATIEDMGRIHADRVSIPSRGFVETLSQLTGASEQAAEAVRRLLAWDGVMDKEEVAPAIYEVTREQVIRLAVSSPLLNDLKGNPFRGEPAALSVEARLWSVVMRMIREDDRSLLEDGTSWDSVLLEAFENAVAWLREQLGDDMDEWTWGRLHTTRPVHPLASMFPEVVADLNPPSVSIGGDADTVQAAGTFPGQNFHVNGTSVARYAFDTGDWDNSRWVVPLGASGHPASPHYADQAIDWSEVRMNPMTYSWDAIVAEAETTQRLEPV